MKQRTRLLALILTVLTMLAVPVMAYEPPTDFQNQTLEEIMTAFMEEKGLHKGNFSVSYYNTVTGESYAFNDTTMMVAASTFKLPLNMYYYEMEQAGEIASDAYISRGGMPLNKAHYESLVNSHNEVSLGMLYNLGNFRTYKEKMRKYFTMTDEEIDASYYHDNYYCTRMMMDALKYLYDHADSFEEMIGYMKEAQPGQYFKAGVEDYEVAHKYGWFEGAVNDVGIIYAPQPFLLAVYTQDTSETVVADTAKLLTAYNVWQSEQEAQKEEESVTVELEVEQEEPDPIPEEPEVTEPKPQEPEPVSQEEPKPEESKTEEPEQEQPKEESAFELWMVFVALGVFAIGGGLTSLLFNPRKVKEKYGKDLNYIEDDDEEDEEDW